MTEREAKVRVTVTGNAAQELQKIEGAVRKVDSSAAHASTSVSSTGTAVSRTGRSAAAASDQVRRFDAVATKMGQDLGRNAVATKAAATAVEGYARGANSGTRAINAFAAAESAATGRTSQLADAHRRLGDEMRALTSIPKPSGMSGTSFLSMLGGGVTTGISVAAAAAAAAVGGLAAGAIGAVRQASELESAMSRVRSATAGSRDEMRLLTSEAARLGAATQYSAAEVAAVQENFAKAGFDVRDIQASTNSALSFAAATGTDTGFASGLMAQTIRAMGFDSRDPRTARMIADSLVVGTRASNVDAPDLAEAMKYAAPVFSGMAGGQRDTAFRDMVALTGILGDQGIRGSMAGTALRSGYSRLASGQGGASAELRRLGVSATGQDGAMRRLPEILSDLRGSLADKTDAQRQTALTRIFGMNAAGAFGAILNADPSRFDELVRQLNLSAGAADRTARVLQDNLSGDLEQLGGAFGGLATTIGTELLPGARNAAGNLTGFVGALNNTLTSADLARTTFGGFNTVLETLGTGLGIMLDETVPKVAGFLELVGILDSGEGARLAEQFAAQSTASKIDRASIMAGRERDQAVTAEQQNRNRLEGIAGQVQAAQGSTGAALAADVRRRLADQGAGDLANLPEVQAQLTRLEGHRGNIGDRARARELERITQQMQPEIDRRKAEAERVRDERIRGVNVAELQAQTAIMGVGQRRVDAAHATAEGGASRSALAGDVATTALSMTGRLFGVTQGIETARQAGQYFGLIGPDAQAPASGSAVQASALDRLGQVLSAPLNQIVTNTRPGASAPTGRQDGGPD